VVGDSLDLVDARDGEVGMVANPLRIFDRDARLAQFGLRFARAELDFLPNAELVLQILPISGRV
jgi:hypothetical protein